MDMKKSLFWAWKLFGSFYKCTPEKLYISPSQKNYCAPRNFAPVNESKVHSITPKCFGEITGHEAIFIDFPLTLVNNMENIAAFSTLQSISVIVILVNKTHARLE